MILPAVCAPMMLVSGPELVAAAMKEGLMAGLPAHNARSIEEFEHWLRQIEQSVRKFEASQNDKLIGPLAVNISAKRTLSEIDSYLAICEKYNVKIIITAMGNPSEIAKRVHGFGAKIFHDVTKITHAEKAAAAGVDGLICIGYGGGGHSGTMSHFVLIPKIRSFFSGVLILAGCATTGASIRAAEILGADLCYLGTRFIATKESRAPDAYKIMLTSESSSALTFTDKVTGVQANWLNESFNQHGLAIERMLVTDAHGRALELPDDVRPWKQLWSAGQGIDLIYDIPSVSELVAKLRAEYQYAVNVPPWRNSASPSLL